MTLFRKEAVEAQVSRHMGSIRLSQPLSSAAVAIGALVLVSALLALATTQDISRKERLRGIVVAEAGSLDVVSTQSGVITARLAHEGQWVERGEPLLSVSSDVQSAQGSLADLVTREIETKEHSLRQEKSSREAQRTRYQALLDQRRKTLDDQAAQAERAAQIADSHLELLSKTVERYKQLSSDHFVSDVQLQAKQDEYLEGRAKREEIARDILSLKQQREQLASDAAAFELQMISDSEQLDRGIAGARQEKTEHLGRSALLITAPAPGIVTSLPLSMGQPIRSGQTAVSIVPSRGANIPLQVNLFSTTRAAGFVHPGQHVYLRYGAFPYEKYGLRSGVVNSVSVTPFDIGDLPAVLGKEVASISPEGEPLYRVVVKLDGDGMHGFSGDNHLKIGMTLDADVVLERRKLWEWILSPVIGAREQLKVLGGSK